MRIVLFGLWLACAPKDGAPPEDTSAADADADGFGPAEDCDDADPAVFPGAIEACNGYDDNCDGNADEGLMVSWWPDTDGDGWGHGTAVVACEAPAGYVADGTDCDDADGTVHPDATEACNARDDDCDGVTDNASATWYTDADGDGYGDAATATETCAPGSGMVSDGTDCDDADPAVNPGVEETCDYDDDNCDGRADQGVVQTWHTDTDGDGYGHMYNTSTTCDPEPGWVLDGTDCRPGDPEAYPGAPERCNDDDDDCDTEIDEDFELDADGYVSTACGGDDCDDTDPDVSPEGVEVCGDGVDNDCSGRDLHCGYGGTFDLGAADAKAYSASPNYDAGRVVDAGDLNADGYDDLVVATMYADGYAGGAYVLYGPISGDGSLDDQGYRIQGSADTYGAGRSIGIADVDGDGYDDVGVGAPDGTEKEWIALGPITGDMNLEDAQILYTGNYGDETGHGADLADVTGDGVGDAIIGAYEDTVGGYATGTVYLEYGPLAAGEFDLDSEYDARLIGDTVGGYAGRYIRAGQDVDGDGIGDILAAAPYASAAGSYSGAAHLVYGGVTGDFDLASADGYFVGENPGDYAGEELALGDVDGDGLADVILGSWNGTGGGYQSGATYVVFGPASGTTDLASADLIIRGNAASQQFGLGLLVADLDADGAGELLVGALGDATVGADAGAAFLFFGPLTAGTLDPTDADATFYGEDAGDQLGEGLAAGDLNADGKIDLAFGAPAEGTGGPNGGAVYVQYPVE